MNEQSVVLITEVFGVDETAAMGILEDMGYHYINNFPVQLLEFLGKIINAKPDPHYSNIALVTTATGHPRFLQYFENIDVNIRVVFLDAPNEKLLLHYEFTRRHHPMMMLSKANTLEETIEVERNMLNALNERAVLHIDTTMVDQYGLKSVLMEKFSLNSKPVFSISLVSFGFKHGIPMGVDPVFDVRFLSNPCYTERLREQIGDDAPVCNYVMSFGQTKESIRHLESFLNYMFIQHKNEKKNHLIVGIGCTRGYRRSASVIN